MRRLLASVALLALPSCTLSADTTTTLVSTSTTTTSLAVAPAHPGPIGDPYFPHLGDAGIDVVHYDLALAVDPETGSITRATATIDLLAATDLPYVTFDLVGLEVVATRIEGHPAPFERDDRKLTVVPATPIAEGDAIRVGVDYRGRPEPFFIPGFDVQAGWVVTPEGVYVIAQPNGASTWYPANDHPSDKATFTVTVTVPPPFVAVSNGDLVGVVETATSSTFTWDMPHPMATYLATLVVGEMTEITRQPVGSIALNDYVPVDLADAPLPALEAVPEMIAALESWFGPYPFSSYGHVVVPGLAIALETQTRTVIGRSALTEATVAHELAHQWFGNSVSVSSWSDIWLSEGLASFAELLWLEESRGSEAMLAEVRRRHQVMADSDHPIISDPGRDRMFDLGVYWRGALTLHALRSVIGDEAMRSVLWEYHDRHAHGHATTPDFMGVAEDASGLDLTDLFHEWLDQPALPPLP